MTFQTWNIKKENGLLETPMGTIKMEGNRHLGHSSIITIECVALRDGVIAAKIYGFSNMEYKERKWVIRDTNGNY